MAKKHKLSHSGISVPVCVTVGAISCLLVTMLGALLLAYMVGNETFGVAGIGIGSMLVLLLSTVLGCWIARALNKEKQLLVCGLTALVFYLSLISITAVFFDGIYTGMGLTALVILFGVGGSLLVGLRKKAGKSKIKIPAYRYVVQKTTVGNYNLPTA